MKEPGRPFTATILVALVLAPTLLAQQPQSSNTLPVDPAAKPRARAMVDAINQRSRELGLISVPDDPAQAEFIRKRMNAQLSEDFEKLHSINVERIVTQSSAPSLDYKTLSDATADLKNRAARIKSFVPLLQFVDKIEKIRYEENPDNLALMLPELSRLINSFLGSPVFRLSSANDLELRRKACRDLEGIIKLSQTINKIAKQSAKTTAVR